MTATVRGVVKEAFVATLRKSENPKEYAGILAAELQEILRREGYAIHAVGACVRIPPSLRGELGRPMTREEMIAVGLPVPALEDAEEAPVDAPIG